MPEFNDKSPETNPGIGIVKPRSLQITTIDLTAYCFLRSWFKYLVDHGFDVTLATTVQEFRNEIEETGAKVVHIPIARNVNPISDFISLINLYKFMKKEKFQSVQTYTTKAGFIGRLAAKLAGVPIIIHNILELPQNSTNNPVLKFLYKKMEQTAANWADHIITTTQPNKRQILKNKIVTPDRLTAVPEGIAVEKYESVKADVIQKRNEFGIPDGSVMVGTVARLEAAKGHTYLLDAIKIILDRLDNGEARLPESAMQSKEETGKHGIYFVIVGKGKLRPTLEKKAKDLGIIDNVKFTGFRNDMLEILQSLDLFVLPSLWEGQGVVIMEALAYKKPVVVSEVGGVVDVVEDGVSGILVPAMDPRALADKILETLQDPQKMREMGEAGYERMKKEFRDSDMNDRRFEVYRKLYNEKLNMII
ncbi:MAG: glycosyltransferase [Candidatus Eremiobacteraeota bacterium]|nr:glycosyltransferase [Candidatus Eremiobacteraeota bacterium]